MKSLIEVFPFLHKTDIEKPFAFIPYKTNAYLLNHPQGNILIYNHSNLEIFQQSIQQLGGVKYHYVSHVHEASNGSTSHKLFDVTLGCSVQEFSQFNSPNVEPILQGNYVELHDEFFAIHTPGHTPGSYTFFWNYSGKSLMFTGDHMFIGNNDNWDTYLSSNNYREAIASLEKLKDYVPNYVFPSGSMTNNFYQKIENQAQWHDMLDGVISKIR